MLVQIDPRAIWRDVTHSLGHANTSVANGEGAVLLVRDDVDAKVLARVKDTGVREGLVTDLVERIGGVGDKLAKEDLLVGVDRVDDEREQLRDLSLELEGLSHCGGFLGISESGSGVVSGVAPDKNG